MSSQNRNFRTPSKINIVDSNREIINKANSVNLLQVLKIYNLDPGHDNRMTCPFAFHSRGRERTPSFNYYENTNSFYCFGCGTGGSSSDFVAAYENKTKYAAAQKILNLISDPDVVFINELKDHKCDEIILEFSMHIREFNHLNKNNYEALTYSETICQVFDDLKSKYSLNQESLQKLVEKLKVKIESF